MIDDLVERDASRAQTALRDRMARVALHLHNLSVLHVDEHAASNRMISWRRPCTGADFQYPVFFGDEWLARSASFSHFTPPPSSVSRRPRQTFAPFRATRILRFGSWERKTRRGVFRTLPHATRDKPPAMGGLTTPYRSHLGKRSRVCYTSGKERDYVVLHLHALQQVRNVLYQGCRSMQKLRSGSTRGGRRMSCMRGHLPCAEGHQARRDYIRR